MAVLLPAYLLAIGLGTLQVGIVSTATMLGSALATLAVGAWGHRLEGNKLLLGAAVLMAATGLGFVGLWSFWPLLVVAFVGTLNPSSGDMSLFLPLEHARLADAAQGGARTALFARYSVLGALCAAIGALAAGLPEWLDHDAGISRLAALAPSLPLALGLLFVRSALSQMDVLTRTAFVMAVVTPSERSAAASFTSVPRSLAAALSPTLSGALFAAGWISLPLVACGALKIADDLALWRAMREHRRSIIR